MAQNTSRSMNTDMRHGALDGRVRFSRPNAGAAQYDEVRKRSDLLPPMLYGYMGFDGYPAFQADDALPAAVRMSPLRRINGDEVAR